MDWQEEPATHQQLLRLREAGFVPTCPLTVTQAARLIRQYSKGPRHAAPPPPGPTFSPEPEQTPARPSVAGSARSGKIGEAARMHAHQLRMTVESVKKVAADSPDTPGVRADVQSAIHARQQFWFDTCRADLGNHIPSVHAMELYRHFGAAFFPPAWEHVGEMLAALDGASSSWDKDHPELFYETVKLNYPSLLRQK